MIDRMIYWILMIAGVIMVFSLLGVMIWLAWTTYKPLVVVPLFMILIIRNILWSYIKGVLTGDSSNFPTFDF